MKTSRHISILSLAVIGALCAMPTSATPILGAGGSGFTVFGASTVANVPTSNIVGSVGGWSSDGANAVGDGNSSSGGGDSSAQGQGGVGSGGSGTAPGAGAGSAVPGSFGAATGNPGSSAGASPSTSSNRGGSTGAPDGHTASISSTNLSGISHGGGGTSDSPPSGPPITSPDSDVQVIDTGVGPGVYVNVGSAPPIDSDPAFVGNIVASGGTTIDTNTNDVCGSFFNRCSGGPTGDNGASAPVTVPEVFSLVPAGGGNGADVLLINHIDAAVVVPEPATLLLFGLGLAGLVLRQRRRH